MGYPMITQTAFARNITRMHAYPFFHYGGTALAKTRTLSSKPSTNERYSFGSFAAARCPCSLIAAVDTSISSSCSLSVRLTPYIYTISEAAWGATDKGYLH